MRRFLRTQLWPAVALLALLTLITGIAYPAAVTAVAQVAFPPRPTDRSSSSTGRRSARR